MRAWSLLTILKDERTHRGNDGYDDVLGNVYCYNSRVPNSRHIRPGDLAVLRDRTHLLGAGLIDSIDYEESEVAVHRCPHPGCGRTGIKERRTFPAEVKYKCGVCRGVFASPRTEMVPVIAYTAQYFSRWSPISPVPTVRDLTAAYINSANQHSIRELDLVTLMSLDLIPTALYPPTENP